MSTKTISTLVVAILLIASFSANSQTTPKENKKAVPAPAKEEPKSKSAEIQFTKTVHDYGTIFEGGDGECEFEFKNVGKEPLVLNNVTSSCGCTVPNWPKDPIMPGKSSSIKVKYSTSRVGGINKTITVISNAEENSKVELRITGNVKIKEESAYPEKQPNSMQAAPTH